MTSTAKVPQNTATFAVLEEEDEAAEFDEFAGLDKKEWRIERRYRRRSDGAIMMYFNYRRRKIGRNEQGERRIEYRKGGKREI